jgi:hypothetical protein
VVAELKSAHRFFYRFQEEQEDDDPRRLIECLQVKLRKKYGATPAFFLGTLEQALNAAFTQNSIEEVRPALYE